MIGHSVGEFVCAALAGVFSLEDALRLVGARGRLMQDLPRGLDAVGAARPPRSSRRASPPSLVVASDNGPSLCVVAGPTDGGGTPAGGARGRGRGLPPPADLARLPLADDGPRRRAVRAQVREVRRCAAPAIPFVSTVTGTWIRPRRRPTRSYWARHLRDDRALRPGGARAAARTRPASCSRSGPRATLATLARQQAAGSGQVARRDARSTRLRRRRGRRLAPGRSASSGPPGVRVDWERLQDSRPAPRVSACPPIRSSASASGSTPPGRRLAFAAVPEPTASSRAGRTAATVAHSRCIEDHARPAAAPRPPRREGAPRAASSAPCSRTSPASTWPARSRTRPSSSSGLDSLALTQVALQLQKDLRRQGHLPPAHGGLSRASSGWPSSWTSSCPPTRAAGARGRRPRPPAAAAVASPRRRAGGRSPAMRRPAAVVPGHVQQVIDAQLQLMAQQLALLGAAPALPAPPVRRPRPSAARQPRSRPGRSAAGRPHAARPAASASGRQGGRRPDEESPAGPMKYDVKKAFGAIARIHTSRSEELTPQPAGPARRLHPPLHRAHPRLEGATPQTHRPHHGRSARGQRLPAGAQGSSSTRSWSSARRGRTSGTSTATSTSTPSTASA